MAANVSDRATSRRPIEATPIAFARAIAAAFQQRGLDFSAVLRNAQVMPLKMQDELAFISSRQFQVLSEAAMRILDDEALGAFERRLPWGSYGMLARASLSAPSLGVALRRWCRHHGLLTGALHISLDVRNGIAAVQVTESQALRIEQRELALVFVLRNLIGLGCWLVKTHIPALEVNLAFEEPPHAMAYKSLFPAAKLRFESYQTELHFDARYLALPLVRDEDALRKMLRENALRVPLLLYRPERLLVNQVYQILATCSTPSINASGVAAKLHLSERTLHRRLARDQTSLLQLKNNVRRERAQALLSQSDRPVKQISAAVGFDNEKSFGRAFRGWTGLTPGQYRRQFLGDAHE